MEEITFHLVHIDGVLANIRPVFNGLATAVLDKPVEVPEDLEPPHWFSRMGEAAGLTEDEVGQVQQAVREIRDFWLSVPPQVVLSPGPDVLAGAVRGVQPCVFAARRCPTRGDPVLIQTIKWLIIHGYKNPIVWIKEE